VALARARDGTQAEDFGVRQQIVGRVHGEPRQPDHQVRLLDEARYPIATPGTSSASVSCEVGFGKLRANPARKLAGCRCQLGDEDVGCRSVRRPQGEMRDDVVVTVDGKHRDEPGRRPCYLHRVPVGTGPPQTS
jgi:hypothetical protein